jgi:hypothetical protein
MGMDRVSDLLAQFPGPLTLRPSRWKWLMLLAVGGAFAGAGLADNINSGSAHAWSWLGVAFFGALTVGAAIAIFVADLRITLDADGFVLRVGKRSERWHWIDVADIAVAAYAPGMRGATLRRRIGFNDVRPAKGKSQIVGELVSRAVTGRDCALPDAYGASSYGLPMEDLARLMSQWRERAIAEQSAGCWPAGGTG